MQAFDGEALEKVPARTAIRSVTTVRNFAFFRTVETPEIYSLAPVGIGKTRGEEVLANAGLKRETCFPGLLKVNLISKAKTR